VSPCDTAQPAPYNTNINAETITKLRSDERLHRHSVSAWFFLYGHFTFSLVRVLNDMFTSGTTVTKLSALFVDTITDVVDQQNPFSLILSGVHWK